MVVFLDFKKNCILSNSTSSHRNQKKNLKKIVVVGFTYPNTSFCNKNSLSYQRKYDGEIVENQKVGSPVVFLWEVFWPKEKTDLYFLLKTLTMPIFREIEEGRVGNKPFCQHYT
jgi:hypothetical protein